MPQVIYFNPHEKLGKDALQVIGEAIQAFSLIKDNFNAINNLYGLYDGYLYPDLISALEELDLDKRLIKAGYNKEEVIFYVKWVQSIILQDTSVK